MINGDGAICIQVEPVSGLRLAPGFPVSYERIRGGRAPGGRFGLPASDDQGHDCKSEYEAAHN